MATIASVDKVIGRGTDELSDLLVALDTKLTTARPKREIAIAHLRGRWAIATYTGRYRLEYYPRNAFGTAQHFTH